MASRADEPNNQLGPKNRCRRGEGDRRSERPRPLPLRGGARHPLLPHGEKVPEGRMRGKNAAGRHGGVQRGFSLFRIGHRLATLPSGQAVRRWLRFPLRRQVESRGPGDRNAAAIAADAILGLPVANGLGRPLDVRSPSIARPGITGPVSFQREPESRTRFPTNRDSVREGIAISGNGRVPQQGYRVNARGPQWGG